MTQEMQMQFGHAPPLTVNVPKALRHSFLLVGILSTPDNDQRRNSIRRSWAQYDGNWTHTFIVGRSDLDERDVTVLDIDESYGGLNSSLPIKVMATYWLGRLLRADFVAKVDDDAYVHVPRALSWLRHAKTPFYGGLLVPHQPPIRHGQWRTPHDIFAGRGPFPTFAHGAGYFVSADAANCFLSYDLTAMPNEDVMSGLCAHVCGVKPTDLQGLVRDCKWHLHLPDCTLDHFVPPFVVWHGVQPATMLAFWAVAATANSKGQRR